MGFYHDIWDSKPDELTVDTAGILLLQDPPHWHKTQCSWCVVSSPDQMRKTPHTTMESLSSTYPSNIFVLRSLRWGPDWKPERRRVDLFVRSTGSLHGGRYYTKWNDWNTDLVWTNKFMSSTSTTSVWYATFTSIKKSENLFQCWQRRISSPYNSIVRCIQEIGAAYFTGLRPTTLLLGKNVLKEMRENHPQQSKYIPDKHSEDNNGTQVTQKLLDKGRVVVWINTIFPTTTMIPYTDLDLQAKIASNND